MKEFLKYGVPNIQKMADINLTVDPKIMILPKIHLKF